MFDFAGMFDCLHDLAEPEATLAKIRSRMTRGGALMVNGVAGIGATGTEPVVYDCLLGNCCHEAFADHDRIHTDHRHLYISAFAL